MSLRNISIALILVLLLAAVSLSAQTAPMPSQTEISARSSTADANAAAALAPDPTADQPSENAGGDAPSQNLPDAEGLVPIEPAKDAKFATAEFRSNRVPWQPLPLVDAAPTE